MIKTGRIIKGVGGLYTVDVGEKTYACKAKGLFRLDKQSPLVGDFVDLEVIDEKEQEGVISHIHPRKNQLLRPKITNVDQNVLVFTLVDPVANFDFLDRISILTHAQGLELLIVVNKMDQVPEDHPDIAYLYRVYGDLYPIIETSAMSQVGVDAVKAAVVEGITVFCGLSGVGKSSLVNLICPAANMETGEISHKNKKGKHTTRYTNLIKMGAGYLADSPGFSSLEFNFPKEALEGYFKEFEPYLGQCRFSNCGHISEPDCAIKPQVGERISPERYERYVSYYENFDLKRR